MYHTSNLCIIHQILCIGTISSDTSCIIHQILDVYLHLHPDERLAPNFAIHGAIHILYSDTAYTAIHGDTAYRMYHPPSDHLPLAINPPRDISASFAARALLRRVFFPVCLSLSGRGQLRNLLPKSSGVVQEQTSVPLLTEGTLGFLGRHHPTLHFIADMNVCGMAGSGGLACNGENIANFAQRNRLGIAWLIA